MPHPLGQGAVGQSLPLGHSRAAEPLTEADIYSLLPLLRREPAPCLGRVGHRRKSVSHGVTPLDLKKIKLSRYNSIILYHKFELLVNNGNSQQRKND